MSWLSILIGIFSGLLIYVGYIVIKTLIDRKKAKKKDSHNNDDVEN